MAANNPDFAISVPLSSVSFSVCWLAYCLHLGISQGVLLALVADQVPPNLRGTAFGLIDLAIGVALLPARAPVQ